MDSSIIQVLQAVQEEFPPNRKSRQSSSSSAAGPSRSASIPINDDNSFPTSAELRLYSGRSPPSNDDPSVALATSPASSIDTPFSDGQQTPRAERTGHANFEEASNLGSSTGSNTGTLSQRESVASSSALPNIDSKQATSSALDRRSDKTSGLNTQDLPPASRTAMPHSRSPKTMSAPSFISLPPSSSSKSSVSSGFNLTTHKVEGLMLTPGGDDIPFVFKKRPDMHDRRPSHEIFT